MSKTLQVIEPFLTLSVGDALELSQDGRNYVNVHKDEFCRSDEEGNDFSSSYEGTIKFSVAYAKELVKNGYLAEQTDSDRPFVNIFTEIDELLNKYTTELNEIEKTMKDSHPCVKLEKTTVLTNLIKLLTYLKGLKK